MTLRLATANRLTDGAAVYLTAIGRWTEFLRDGDIARDDDAAARLLAVAERGFAADEVVGPYLIEMTDHDGVVMPSRLRETIRAAGPTIAALPGREAERKHPDVPL